MSGVRFMQRWAVVERTPSGPVRVVSGHYTRRSAIRAVRWRVEHPDRSVLRRSWTVSVVPTRWARTSHLSTTVIDQLGRHQCLSVTGLIHHTALPADTLEWVLLGLARVGRVTHAAADPETGRITGTWRLTTHLEQVAATPEVR